MFIFKGSPLNPARCAASVRGSGSWIACQCSRKPTVRRKYEGKTYGFCKQHDPEVRASKQAARRAEWDRKYAERTARDERSEQRQKAYRACRDALVKILAGHNDIVGLTRDTLALFPPEEPDETE